MDIQQFLLRAWSIIRIVVLVGGTAAAAVLAIHSVVTGAVTWRHVVIFAVAVVWIRVSITLYMHRYATHGAYKFTRVGQCLVKPWLVFGAAFAVQGDTGTWVRMHTRHHQHADDFQKDAHSPNAPGGFWHKAWGFLWAHVVWMALMSPDKDMRLNWQPDWLERRFCNGFTYLLLGPGLAAGMAWYIGGGLGVAWYFAAVCFTLHVTWGVNSIGHMFGTKPFNSKDQSRNVWWLVWLSPEYWHGNHHAFPKSARLGFTGTETAFDPEYGLLLLCRSLHLVRALNIPTPADIGRRRIQG